MIIRTVILSLGLSLAAISAPAEIPPQPTLPCFPGAYYRKAVSSQDVWTGIEGVVTLPQFEPDASRINPKTGRHMDNASIYMGGKAGDQEIDAGVSWEVIKEADGSVSKLGKAYRPFWRNEKWQSGPAKPDFYYYPGDTIRMRVQTVERGKLMMSIELLKRGEKAQTAEVSTQTTETTGNVTKKKEEPATGGFAAVTPDAVTSLSVSFEARNFGPDQIQEFKRVNAIDQSGNERKQVQPTSAGVSRATWEHVYLLRGDERVPMSLTRFTDMRCPDKSNFTIYRFGESGERISIRGSAK